MSYQDFPPALLTLSPRLTLAGDPGSSLVGINTTPIADGAWCYCVQNKSEYQLDKADSTTAADGSTVLAPLAGPGRWFKRLPAISTTVVWRPDGLGDVTTFAQVMAVVAANKGPTTIYCPQIGPSPVYVIDPGPPPAAPVVYDMKGSQFVAPRGPHDAIQIQIRRGATLLNLARIAGGLRLQANKLTGDPKALDFTTADPAISAVFVVDDGASLTNNTGATDPMILVGTTPTEFYLVFNQMGTAEAKGGAVPVVNTVSGAILNVNVLSGGLSLDGIQPAGWIGSVAGSTVNWIHDGTMAFPPGFWPPGIYNPDNLGTQVNQPTGCVGGMGPSANRPKFQGGGNPGFGCMYFDTDLNLGPDGPGKPIWFNGNGTSGWVDATGTAVP